MDDKYIFIPWTDKWYDISKNWSVRSYRKRQFEWKNQYWIISNKPQQILMWCKTKDWRAIWIKFKNWRKTIYLHILLYKSFKSDYNSRKFCMWYKDWNMNNIILDNLCLVPRKTATDKWMSKRVILNSTSVEMLRKEFKSFINKMCKKYWVSKQTLRWTVTFKQWKI